MGEIINVNCTNARMVLPLFELFVNNNNNNNGFKVRLASKDVIGDPSRPGTNNSEQLEPRREEREKVLESRTNFHFNRAEKKRVAYGGKKCVFRPERNVGSYYRNEEQ